MTNRRTTHPVPMDMSASEEDRMAALALSLATGRPLRLFDSTSPDVPPLDIGMELSLVDTGSAAEAVQP